MCGGTTNRSRDLCEDEFARYQIGVVEERVQ